MKSYNERLLEQQKRLLQKLTKKDVLKNVSLMISPIDDSDNNLRDLTAGEMADFSETAADRVG